MAEFSIEPTQKEQRIKSLDVLRGFAILGILIINIQFFARPSSAFANPSVMGNLSRSDFFSYYVSLVFGELKFMTIFSILFGAGILLFVNRLHEKNLNGEKYHIRRMMWLFLFGMLHAYFIWFGDILVAYSLIGMLAVLLRKISDSWKMVLFSALFLIPMFFFYLIGHHLETLPEAMVQEVMPDFKPNAEAILTEINLYQTGSWLDIFMKRAQLNLNFQIGSFFMFSLWRTVGMMLLGMVLLKNGVLTAQKSKLFYLLMAIIGIGLGTLISNRGFFEIVDSNWDIVHYFKIGYQFNYMGSLFSSLGYVGLVILIQKLNILQILMKALEAVGRMAFTNYLCQSIICSLIFYSYGFGLFGSFSLYELLAWVVGIWIFQLISSSIWLKYYKMGPFEWLWRYLTYKEKPQLILNVKYE